MTESLAALGTVIFIAGSMVCFPVIIWREVDWRDPRYGGKQLQMRRACLAAGILTIISANQAQAGTAEFIRTAIGCPTEEGLTTVYMALATNPDDYETIQSIVSQYDCKVIDRGVKLILISRDATLSVVAWPHTFSKDTWYYVPNLSVTPLP